MEDLPSYAALSVQRVTQPSLSTRPVGPGVVVYFESEDLDSTVARLKEGGLRFEFDSQDQPWGGNVICFFREGENRKNPPWRLKRN